METVDNADRDQRPPRGKRARGLENLHGHPLRRCPYCGRPHWRESDACSYCADLPGLEPL